MTIKAVVSNSNRRRTLPPITKRCSRECGFCARWGVSTSARRLWLQKLNWGAMDGKSRECAGQRQTICRCDKKRQQGQSRPNRWTALSTTIAALWQKWRNRKKSDVARHSATTKPHFQQRWLHSGKETKRKGKAMSRDSQRQRWLREASSLHSAKKRKRCRKRSKSSLHCHQTTAIKLLHFEEATSFRATHSGLATKFMLLHSGTATFYDAAALSISDAINQTALSVCDSIVCRCTLNSRWQFTSLHSEERLSLLAISVCDIALCQTRRDVAALCPLFSVRQKNGFGGDRRQAHRGTALWSAFTSPRFEWPALWPSGPKVMERNLFGDGQIFASFSKESACEQLRWKCAGFLMFVLTISVICEAKTECNRLPLGRKSCLKVWGA